MTRRAALVVIMVAAAALATAYTAARRAGSDPSPAAPAVFAQLSYRYLTNLSDGTVGRNYGYNLVDLGPDRAAIDALPTGERALVWIGNYSLSDCAFTMSDADLRQALARLARDPKVAGYYLADEADDARPDYGGHCPDVVAQITQRSRLVHRLVPDAFTYEVVTEPGNFAAFARATDVLGADPYPCLIGHPCDWTMIPRYIAALNAAHVARYWGLLQAFAQPPWRFPTPGELQEMIRQWQRSRWQGEQTFAWSFAGNSLASHPDLLAVLGALNHGS